MSTDPAQAVLRDFENVIWLTILMGLVLAGVGRFFFSHTGELVPADASAPRPAEPVAGLPVAHFTWADFLFLPLVLVKYSVTLQLAFGGLFALPGQAAEKFGLLESAPDAAQLTEPVRMQMSSLLILVDMSINIFLIGIVLLMIQWVGRRRVEEVFGLDRFKGKLLTPLLWIIGGALIATPAILITSNYMPQLFDGLFGEGMEEQAAVQSMRDSSDWFLRVLLIANACLMAPVVEELVFRGYFYGIMKRHTGAMFAAFVTGAIFAVAHQSLLALLPLWGFALFLTLFYEASRSLWVPIGIHAVFNAANVSFILFGFGGDGGGAG